MKRLDIIGNTYGRLTVIEFTEVKPDSYWLCECECGTIKEIRGAELRNGKIQSCGCLHKEKVTLTKGEAAFNKRFSTYISGATKRGYSFNLTADEFRILTKQDCHYCGAPPGNVSSAKGFNGSYTYSGIDRVENNIGYEIDNVVPCCKDCNMAKRKMSKELFLSWITKVYKHSIEKIV